MEMVRLSCIIEGSGLAARVAARAGGSRDWARAFELARWREREREQMRHGIGLREKPKLHGLGAGGDEKHDGAWDGSRADRAGGRDARQGGDEG